VDTLLTLDADELFPFIPDRVYGKQKKKFIIDGVKYVVKMSSSRLVIFKKNPACVCCGIAGSKFLLQRPTSKPNETPHFNFFAEEDDGELLLMTKDHINPVAKGGKNSISNYQTMCTKCNNLKGSDPISIESLRDIRQTYLTLLKGMTHRKAFHIIEGMKAEIISAVDNSTSSG